MVATLCNHFARMENPLQVGFGVSLRHPQGSMGFEIPDCISSNRTFDHPQLIIRIVSILVRREGFNLRTVFAKNWCLFIMMLALWQKFTSPKD
jgi:hypothetical protein